MNITDKILEQLSSSPRPIPGSTLPVNNGSGLFGGRSPMGSLGSRAGSGRKINSMDKNCSPSGYSVRISKSIMFWIPQWTYLSILLLLFVFRDTVVVPSRTTEHHRAPVTFRTIWMTYTNTKLTTSISHIPVHRTRCVL